jgi:hypothetical protein
VRPPRDGRARQPQPHQVLHPRQLTQSSVGQPRSVLDLQPLQTVRLQSAKPIVGDVSTVIDQQALKILKTIQGL